MYVGKYEDMRPESALYQALQHGHRRTPHDPFLRSRSYPSLRIDLDVLAKIT